MVFKNINNGQVANITNEILIEEYKNNNNWVQGTEADLPKEPIFIEPTIEGIERQQRKAEIKSRLTELSEDIVQDQAGEYVPNINERKVEFIRLHNELRELEGKAPRILK